MVKRIGSTHRKTRSVYSLHYRQRGKISVSRYYQEFQTGDNVHLAVYPNVQFGRFFRRFQGMGGVVTGKKGECYEVMIHDGEKEKKLYIHPIHLQKGK